MILVIRISGMVKVPRRIEATLDRLGLRKKYTARLLEDTAENHKLLKKIRNYVAYGPVNDDMLDKLVRLRGKDVKSGTEKGMEVKLDSGTRKVKKYFRLHPPRGGIETKKHAGRGKGVLGDNKEKINELLARML